MKYRLTREADAHITEILRTTNKLFGAKQVQTYSKIISDGIKMIADDPHRPSTTAGRLERRRQVFTSGTCFQATVQRLSPDIL